jgi:hypothetical protein
MGIVVPEVALSSGVVLKNVYMSFSFETLDVSKTANTFVLQSFYRIYPDPTHGNGSEFRFSHRVEMPTMNSMTDMYNALYDGLKAKYPGSVDFKENFVKASVDPVNPVALLW